MSKKGFAVRIFLFFGSLVAAGLFWRDSPSPSSHRRHSAWPVVRGGDSGHSDGSSAHKPAGMPNAAASGVTALMEMKPDRRREILRRTGNAEEARAAAWAMGNRTTLSDEDVEALLDRLAKGTAGEGRLIKTLFWALSQRRDRFPVEEAIRIARDHPDAEARRGAIRGMGTLPDPRVADAVESVALRDADPVNRREALLFLTMSVAPSRSAALAVQALATEGDLDVRSSWLGLVAAHGTEEGRALLRQVLYSSAEDPRVRATAGEMLAARSAEEARALAADSSLPADLRKRIQEIFLSPKTQSGGSEVLK